MIYLVFSLFLVCRAIGIPCRPVSNLVSAHDSNASLTVDKYFDKDNNEIEYDPNNEMGEDSIWNYHVWNDVYMARPDLPKGKKLYKLSLTSFALWNRKTAIFFNTQKS